MADGKYNDGLLPKTQTFVLLGALGASIETARRDAQKLRYTHLARRPVNAHCPSDAM